MTTNTGNLLDRFCSLWEAFHPHPLTPSPIKGEGEPDSLSPLSRAKKAKHPLSSPHNKKRSIIRLPPFEGDLKGGRGVGMCSLS
ncbi:hypothetical protein MC7420_5413 [Coleofasciculus chthonoplastes PCC 7420]|uniref:Uncharacterized protein n=1 Tax=Coleofasciculus chthonoplastes PCC 7420 TaxID=118168 RepID=B4VQ75_9CYAN|nr:hypothetical protein MC7420_5413 [Coleofasciculus chthonoplastes PCC 7420]